MTKEQAVRSASDQLRAIEAWGRRTYYASLATAVCMGIVAIAVIVAGWEYYRLKSAVSQAQSSIAKGFSKGQPFRLPR
jgi:predicted negative regulator of RcsB-dependent stress response